MKKNPNSLLFLFCVCLLTGIIAPSVDGQNTIYGSGALPTNSGSYNTALGLYSLYSNSSGAYNNAVGTAAMVSNTTGTNNTVVGLYSCYGNTGGLDNCGIGNQALQLNTVGSNNVALGLQALLQCTGSNNIGIGTQGGYLLTTGSNNICIGNSGVAGESDTIRIGTPGVHAKTVLPAFVGIGTNLPAVALDVVGSTYLTASINYFDIDSGLTLYTGLSPYTIRANSGISGSFFAAVSDERIKAIDGRSDSRDDLTKLLGIEVTDYRYKDAVEKGNGPQKKVIAQQVEKIFPQAVRRCTDVVPDIYQKALIRDGWVSLGTDLKVGDRVRLITQEGHRAVHEVVEVGDGKFRTDFAEKVGLIFVYGREVKDFRSVDYDAISMLNVSATQELARQLKDRDPEVAALHEENSRIKNQLAAQAIENADLQKQVQFQTLHDQQMEARLARLEQAISQLAAKNVRLALAK